MIISVHADDPDGSLLEVVRPMYAEIYAEPPYQEGPADVADFAKGWGSRTAQPGFRLASARADAGPVGFGFGHRLRPDTKWWNGLTDRLPGDVICEREGRTFAIIELAVRARFRRRGIGQALHAALLRGRTEERVTLLVRPEPEAEPARAAYASWGYRVLGHLRPYPHAPRCIVMVRELTPP